ncbi:ABC transporter permease [Salipiger sp.]|uniref:ABC transporter permease n=1 Tax=Salipiger sp. TaxID=2078585 RepID=UPI003A97712B
MGRYIFRRCFQGLVTLLVVSVVVFMLARMSGDPVMLLLPEFGTEEDAARLREQLGLDRPLVVQYSYFIANALQGDFGVSIKTSAPVTELIGERLPSSILLSAAAMAIAVVVGLPLGIVAAVRKGTWIDTVARVIALFGQSVPNFAMGVLLILIFSVQLRWLPSFGQTGWQSLIMPAVTLGSSMVLAGITRLVRSGMLDVLDSDYVKLARIKGLSEARVIWKHALHNAVLPVLTFVGFYFALIVGGVVVTETVFSWPGLGRLAYEAVLWHDFPLIQAIVLLLAAVSISVNLLVDILYAWLDPRIRYGS